MSTYSEYQQRLLDQSSGLEVDRALARADAKQMQPAIPVNLPFESVPAKKVESAVSSHQMRGQGITSFQAGNLSSAFQEGADTALLHQAPINPYRRAMRALTDPDSIARLIQLAQEWEDGYVSNRK